ncbi:MAG: YitT family protein [Muribaculaceae bacterium]|nr:YitT family protein [Muribaculaceae bacterium]
MTKKIHYDSLFHSAKDYFFIVLGIAFYAFGFTAFVLPHHVVMGGLTGVGTLVFYASNELIPVAVTGYACNLTLLAIAFKIVGKTFVKRTIFGATIVAIMIGWMQPVFLGLSHPLMEDPTMSIVLGGLLCGLGIGTIFIHNGSSGGTDIVAAMVSKLSNVSIGRTMIITDMLIVSSSIFLPFDGTLMERFQVRLPLIVYGLVVTYLTSFMTDMLINTNRQATQFIIFSREWQKIADGINSVAHRGVTVMDGMGWYSKHEVKILLVWCRKIESVTMFRIIKSIDPDAFIAQSKANGVYGKGFDTMKVRLKKPKHHSTLPEHKASEAAHPYRPDEEPNLAAD